MSYDFNTRTAPCPHVISEERYIVDAKDFRTLHLAANTSLNMRAPINGQSTLTLRISGTLVQPDDPTYGYDILADENRLQTNDQFYKVMFRKPVRWFVPLIEAGYITRQPYCLRCSAQGQLNDLKMSGIGGLLRVVNTDKLIQKVLKFVLTSRCSFYPQFTCKIKDYVGKKFGNAVTEADVSSQILDALQDVKSVQAAQRTVQDLSLQEMLKDVTGISSSMPDPTSVSVECSITSYGVQSSPLPVNFTVSSTRDRVGN